ncbi:MAG: glycosyltransferase family 2 protein [Candidatus Nanosynbacter sp.]|nr:glycosyltransferase family 2 protein [Candidatus Nanosynbacter sp.]
MPKLSIIIPAYNAEQYIESCLDSILQNSKESLSETEIIVINDGSTDNTLKILESYNQYKNIKIHTTKNQGVSAARNLGISLAKGEWITFIDADDTISDHFVDKNIPRFNEDILIKCEVVNQTPDKAQVGGAVNKTTREFLHGLILGQIDGFSFSYFYDSKILKSIRFREDIHFMEDSVLLIEYLKKCKAKEIIEYKDVFYFYRNNMESASNNSVNMLRNIKDASKVFEIRKNLLDGTWNSDNKKALCKARFRIYENQIAKIDNRKEYIKVKRDKDFRQILKNGIRIPETSLLSKMYFLIILYSPYVVFLMYRIIRKQLKELKHA